ncbi:MAG: ATP-binding protein [Alphaproteobacteria bacterium]|nr:ATP-binding protein [Alphaproteobacteria bacterium]MCB9695635.1 ATP-binding protein [Alphaproteobacteria bacterium]
MDLSARLEQVIRDGQEAPLAPLIPRDVRLWSLPGKADAVVGMRRVGKTSLLLAHMADRVAAGHPRRNLAYVNFEDDRLAGLQTEDLHLVHEAALRLGEPDGERWLYLDEVQNVPGWERFVRRMVETPGQRVAVTGSSSRLLSTEIATSLRGRSLTVELLPFGFREALRHRGLPEPDRLPTSTVAQAALERAFDQWFETGGFPEAQDLDARARAALMRSYVDVVILRDVVERHGVTNVAALRALTRRLLAAPAGRFTVNRFTNDLKSQGIPASRELVDGLFQHLEDAFLVGSVPLATDSAQKRAVNPRKVYPIDTALVPTLTRSEMRGHRLETVVYVELRRRGYEVGWARTRSDFEVDFVARHPEREPLLVQVAWDLSEPGTRERELRALAEAADEHDIDRAHLITRSTRESTRAGRCEVEVWPAWWWLLA